MHLNMTLEKTKFFKLKKIFLINITKFIYFIFSLPYLANFKFMHKFILTLFVYCYVDFVPRGETVNIDLDMVIKILRCVFMF
jgi:hypothetical protein